MEPPKALLEITAIINGISICEVIYVETINIVKFLNPKSINEFGEINHKMNSIPDLCSVITWPNSMIGNGIDILINDYLVNIRIISYDSKIRHKDQISDFANKLYTNTINSYTNMLRETKSTRLNGLSISLNPTVRDGINRLQQEITIAKLNIAKYGL